MELRDLPPRKDPKGGSPKTPSGGIPVREFRMDSDYPIISDHSGVWRTIATGLAGGIVGLTAAWFTAFTNKGVTHAELEEYTAKYSPYSMEKASIAEHNVNQDTKLGELGGKQERTFERLGTLEKNQSNDERELSEFKTETRKNLENIANLLEEQRKAKK